MDDSLIEASQPLLDPTENDIILAPEMGKERLYRLWEENNWSAKHLDFTQDSLDWREKFTEEQREAILWNFAMFLDGEESVTITLAPFMEAMKGYDDKIFLATQIADEARHHVFFDRFLREVCQIGNSYDSTLTTLRARLSWGYSQVFQELDRVAERLRRTPHNRLLLTRGIVLYHLIIEGMLAHTGQHYLSDYTRRHKLFPGFATGIQMVARDESRHIAFGVQLLHELTTTDPACKAAAIEMLNRVLPWAACVFVPPDNDWSYLKVLGYTPQEIFTFALRSLESRLPRAGIQPEEVLALVKLGSTTAPEQQATLAIALIDGGVLGTKQTSQISEAALTSLFISMRQTIAWTQRHRLKQPLQATIKWDFTDAQPRYVVVDTSQLPEVTTESTGQPHLSLSCSAYDWIAIARGSLNLFQAILTRRLRIHGSWRLARLLPALLPGQET